MVTLLPAGIDRAVAVLRGGGVGAFPTDTVYGLGCSPLLPAAVERIFRLKRRPPAQPLPLLLSDREQVEMAVAFVSPLAAKLMDAFWPGALTLVLPRSSLIPEVVCAGGLGVGVRLPDHPVPRALARGVGVPIVGTSANISGRPSPRTAAEAREQMDEELDFIIDGGPCPGGVESTVVELLGEPRLLREGAIPRQRIEEMIGCALR